MITDDERREVARGLRELANGYEEVSDFDLARTLGLGAVSRYGYDPDDVRRLADLIEPESERTCRVECYPPGYEGNLHYEVCSECGTILTASRPGDSHSKRANYCPSCGALIIGEETGNDD